MLSGGVELGDGMGAVNLGMDHHTSCVKIHAHVQDQPPDNVLVTPGCCKQHAAGLATAPTVNAWQILCPLFCLVKLLRKSNFWSKVED